MDDGDIDDDKSDGVRLKAKKKVTITYKTGDPQQDESASDNYSFKENFSEAVNEYKFGNWSKRAHFLPPLSSSAVEQDGGLIALRLKEKTKAGDVDSVKILLHSSVSPNLSVDHRRRTALHYATLRADVPMVQLLLRFSADPGKLDSSLDGPTPERAGWSPLELAQKAENLPILALFSAEVHPHTGRAPDGIKGKLNLGVQPARLLDATGMAGRPLRIDLRACEPSFLYRPEAERSARCTTSLSYHSSTRGSPSPFSARPGSRNQMGGGF
eukprot:TRINITY_DN41569_c0_g1_i1.p1 TRINITY_DN41569_c0_g1~~TRINITY_DN41569_c0_g1_i1.p1  ORF type:complete len:270 (+),score=61.44 TRINITY_DN41569_c0_g1_i1:210-1019(+)